MVDSWLGLPCVARLWTRTTLLYVRTHLNIVINSVGRFIVDAWDAWIKCCQFGPPTTQNVGSRAARRQGCSEAHGSDTYPRRVSSHTELRTGELRAHGLGRAERRRCGTCNGTCKAAIATPRVCAEEDGLWKLRRARHQPERHQVQPPPAKEHVWRRGATLVRHAMRRAFRVPTGQRYAAAGQHEHPHGIARRHAARVPRLPRAAHPLARLQPDARAGVRRRRGGIYWEAAVDRDADRGGRVRVAAGVLLVHGAAQRGRRGRPVTSWLWDQRLGFASGVAAFSCGVRRTEQAGAGAAALDGVAAFLSSGACLPVDAAGAFALRTWGSAAETQRTTGDELTGCLSSEQVGAGAAAFDGIAAFLSSGPWVPVDTAAFLYCRAEHPEFVCVAADSWRGAAAATRKACLLGPPACCSRSYVGQRGGDAEDRGRWRLGRAAGEQLGSSWRGPPGSCPRSLLLMAPSFLDGLACRLTAAGLGSWVGAAAAARARRTLCSCMRQYGARARGVLVHARMQPHAQPVCIPCACMHAHADLHADEGAQQPS